MVFSLGHNTRNEDHKKNYGSNHPHVKKKKKKKKCRYQCWKKTWILGSGIPFGTFLTDYLQGFADDFQDLTDDFQEITDFYYSFNKTTKSI